MHLLRESTILQVGKFCSYFSLHFFWHIKNTITPWFDKIYSVAFRRAHVLVAALFSYLQGFFVYTPFCGYTTQLSPWRCTILICILQPRSCSGLDTYIHWLKPSHWDASRIFRFNIIPNLSSLCFSLSYKLVNGNSIGSCVKVRIYTHCSSFMTLLSLTLQSFCWKLKASQFILQISCTLLFILPY